MSIKIIKAGISDAFFDEGRFGHQQSGINPTGAMDTVSIKIANALVNNFYNEAVLEMHFPAATILFEKPALVALSGANFSATVNDKILPINTPILIHQQTVLHFKNPVEGARVYLSIRGGFALQPWLNSYSTNSLIKVGGFNGRALQKDDIVSFNQQYDYPVNNTSKPFKILPLSASTVGLYKQGALRIIAGPHFKNLTTDSQQQLVLQSFTITNDNNRMGYRLKSSPLQLSKTQNIISSAVTYGCVQLLPNGQLLILMADHQTTGGYPIVAKVIAADLVSLAQKKSSDSISFQIVTPAAAEEAYMLQHRHLLQIQNACKLQLNDRINFLCRS